jgi:hypothetical protein
VKKASFDFYGVGVEVSSANEDQEIVEWIKEDFQFFYRTGLKFSPLLIFKITKNFQYISKPIVRIQTPRVTTEGLDSYRVCNYGDGCRVSSFSSNGIRIFQISGVKKWIHEMIYMAILSAVGEELDQRGFHRVHALGLQYKKRNLLVLLPQGGGKSALANLLLKEAGFKIFSDEIPLVKDGVLFPFPIRMALRPQVAQGLNLDTKGARILLRKKFPEKILFPIPLEKIPQSEKVNALLVGVRAKGTPKIVRSSFWLGVRELLKSLVVGLGTPQMAEHMLRLSNVLVIPRIAASRSIELLRLQSCPTFKFSVTPDAFENAVVLKEFLNRDFL